MKMIIKNIRLDPEDLEKIERLRPHMEGMLKELTGKPLSEASLIRWILKAGIETQESRYLPVDMQRTTK